MCPIQDQDKTTVCIAFWMWSNDQKTRQNQVLTHHMALAKRFQRAKTFCLPETYHVQAHSCWEQSLHFDSEDAQCPFVTPGMEVLKMLKRRMMKRKRLVWIWNANHSVSVDFQKSWYLDSRGLDAVWLALPGRSSLYCPLHALGLWVFLLWTT